LLLRDADRGTERRFRFADDDLGPKNNAGLVRLSCGHRLVIDHFIFCGRLRS